MDEKVFTDIAQRMRKQRENQGLSYRELSERTGLSKSTLQRYETGFIRSVPLSKLKTLSVALNCSPEYLMGWERLETEECTVLPIIGSVAAGVPIEESQDIDGYAEVSGDTRNTYALRVHGDSMYPEFHDGDTVIIKKQSSYKNGDIVVARVNGYEYTVKKYRRNNNDVLLIPVNSDFEPMVYDESVIAIEGRVVEARRKY